MEDMGTSYYAKRIAEITGRNPRHVEAFMRSQYSTLDHLSPEQFREEALICAACVDAVGPEEAEATAVSFGL